MHSQRPAEVFGSIFSVSFGTFAGGQLDHLDHLDHLGGERRMSTSCSRRLTGALVAMLTTSPRRLAWSLEAFSQFPPLAPLLAASSSTTATTTTTWEVNGGTSFRRHGTCTREKSNEALIEAWAASVMTSEHLEVAVKDHHFFEHLLENVGLGTVDPSPKHCENMTVLAQEAYSRGLVSVMSTLQPLALQLSTFKVLTAYQEKELQHRRLDYVPAPTSTTSYLLLQNVSDPSSTRGHHLAVRALNLGKQLCPAPEDCEEGMLLPPSVAHGRHGLVKCGSKYVMAKDVAKFLLVNLTLRPEPVQPLLWF